MPKTTTHDNMPTAGRTVPTGGFGDFVASQASRLQAENAELKWEIKRLTATVETLTAAQSATKDAFEKVTEAVGTLGAYLD